MCNPKRVFIPKIIKEDMIKDCPDEMLMPVYEKLVKSNALKHEKQRLVYSEAWFDFIVAEYEDKRMALQDL